MVILLIASFALGFAICLVILGRSEHEQAKKISELEKENRELKIDYLNKCWKNNSDND